MIKVEPLSGLYPHLELQHQLHTVTTERTDVIKNQGRDDVNAVALMRDNACLQRDKNQSEFHELERKIMSLSENLFQKETLCF